MYVIRVAITCQPGNAWQDDLHSYFATMPKKLLPTSAKKSQELAGSAPFHQELLGRAEASATLANLSRFSLYNQALQPLRILCHRRGSGKRMKSLIPSLVIIFKTVLFAEARTIMFYILLVYDCVCTVY